MNEGKFAILPYLINFVWYLLEDSYGFMVE